MLALVAINKWGDTLQHIDRQLLLYLLVEVDGVGRVDWMNQTILVNREVEQERCVMSHTSVIEVAKVVNGYTYVDHLIWDAYNESSDLILQTELYKKRFGILPNEIQADRLYLGKANRKYIKDSNK